MPKRTNLSYASNFDGLPADYKGEPASKRPGNTPHIASITPAAETIGAAPAAGPKQAAPQPAPAVAAKAVKPQRKVVVVHRRQRQDDDGWSGGNNNRRDFAFGSRDPFSSGYREPSWRDSWASSEFEQPRVSRRAARSNNDYWSFR
jgi:hypothetical protein